MIQNDEQLKTTLERITEAASVSCHPSVPAAAVSASARLLLRRGDRFTSPFLQAVFVLKNRIRHSIVGLGGRPIPGRLKRAHSGRQVVGPASIIHLEIELVIVENSEKDILVVEAHAA